MSNLDFILLTIALCKFRKCIYSCGISVPNDLKTSALTLSTSMLWTTEMYQTIVINFFNPFMCCIYFYI